MAGAPITAQALLMRLRHRAMQAAIAHCSPHNLHRTYVSSALHSCADLALVQALAGHSNPATTARHDRTPEEARRSAAGFVHILYTEQYDG